MTTTTKLTEVKMKANELRIGNVVNIVNTTRDFLGRVWYSDALISHEDIYDIARGNGYQYNPIPLTEEWLLKFGFITKGIHYNFTLGNMEIASAIRVLSTNERGKFYLDGDIPEWMKIKLEYVHQLQNLYFVFAGEELEIKN